MPSAAAIPAAFIAAARSADEGSLVMAPGAATPRDGLGFGLGPAACAWEAPAPRVTASATARAPAPVRIQRPRRAGESPGRPGMPDGDCTVTPFWGVVPAETRPGEGGTEAESVRSLDAPHPVPSARS